MIKQHYFSKKGNQNVLFSGRIKSINKETGQFLLEEKGNVRKINARIEIISKFEIGDQIGAFVQKSIDGWTLLGTPEKSNKKYRSNANSFR